MPRGVCPTCRRPPLLALLVAHAGLAALAPVLVRRWGRRAFLALALAPGAAAVWALGQRPVTGGQVTSEHLSWVPSIGLEVSLRLGIVPWLMTLVVGGVGALVLAYCAWYFTDDEPGLAPLAGTLVVFAGSMLGLVWSDNLLVLYVFWELTSIFSFLLIGHDPTKRAARTSATQALIVTTVGGLAMLIGILLIGAQTGTFSVFQLVSHPPTVTPALSAAVVLLLLGALSKSAIFPFHFWLPAAMAAPTPVSAYLHAAAMVKAGVFLVALLGPGLATVPGWRVLLVPLGLLTMLLGAWRALRQYDLKLLLAHGTVSQLGMLITVLGIGSPAAGRAGLVLLLSHALFKSCLFLVVGVVDRQAGTRDLRELTGLWRDLPVVFVAAALAVGSMAGLPPLVGFLGKESMWAAVADSIDAGSSPTGGAGVLVLVGLVLGSALTVAYGARFLHGAFGHHPGATASARRAPVGFWSFPVALSGVGLVLGFAGGGLTRLVEPYLAQFPDAAPLEPLALWHRPGLPAALSTVALLAGLALFAGRHQFGRLQGRLGTKTSLEKGYQTLLWGLERLAVAVTGFTQRGSLASYLGVMLVVVILIPGWALWGAPWSTPWVWLDSPTQAVVAFAIGIAAIATARSRRRMRAVILLGVTGYGTAVLFLVHGAPDLALTQILVESVSLVVFVLVLRRLPTHFTDRPLASTRYWRILIAVGSAVVVAGVLVLAVGARTLQPPTLELAGAAVDFGHGVNIVNVTLVDVRAWDTFGEISVLLAAATGVASLIFVSTRSVRIRRVRDIPRSQGVPPLATGPGRRVWLPAPRTMAPENRSILFEVITRLLFHAMVLLSLYLLFAGHNDPGGGFAGGIVVGLALTVRYLAGGRYELDEAAPIDAGVVLGLGLFVGALSAVAPLMFGGQVLESFVAELHLPLVGEVELVSSLFFDIGVYLVVLGVMLDLLRSLGSGIDRHQRQDEVEPAALEGSS